MWTSLANDAPAVTESIGVTQLIAPYMGVFFIAFFIAIGLTPLMRLLAVRNGIIDQPDLMRKAHRWPVAYLGGVAIFVAWLAAITLCYFTVPHEAGTAGSMGFVSFPVTIVLGAAAITLTGLFDDVYGISPRVKIGGQLFAAAAIAQEGVGLRLVEFTFGLMGFGEMPDWVLYLLGTAVIAVFVVGACNSMNLIDGLDGLAAGVTAIAAMGFLVIAAIIAVRGWADMSVDLHMDPVRIVMCLAILGAVLGFLPYNFNPATIFMGDAGSLLLGYLCITTVLLFAETAGNGLLMVTAALIVFALPITDTSLAIFRRTMRGKPILSPDNQHIHHLLRRAGFSVKQSVLLLYTLAGMFAMLGVALVAMELRWRYVLAIFVVLYGFILVTAYKYGQQQAEAMDAGEVTDDLPEAAMPETAETDQGQGAQPAANGSSSDAAPVATRSKKSSEPV